MSLDPVTLAFMAGSFLLDKVASDSAQGDRDDAVAQMRAIQDKYSERDRKLVLNANQKAYDPKNISGNLQTEAGKTSGDINSFINETTAPLGTGSDITGRTSDAYRTAKTDTDTANAEYGTRLSGLISQLMAPNAVKRGQSYIMADADAERLIADASKRGQLSAQELKFNSAQPDPMLSAVSDIMSFAPYITGGTAGTKVTNRAGGSMRGNQIPALFAR